MWKLQKLRTTFFPNGVRKFNIRGYLSKFTDNANLHPVSNAINIFRNHPSIIKIKGSVRIEKQFSFSFLEEVRVAEIISQLNINTYNNIPAKILVENNDNCASFISKILNDHITH